MRLYTLLLGTVGGISLLVGGIGVMNVMLVAVAERKAEIGIRRALGARRRDIQAQFLSEAMILSLLGGVIGALLAILATYGICRFTGWIFTVSVNGTVLGTVVAGGAGIFFGLYPALPGGKARPGGRAARVRKPGGRPCPDPSADHPGGGRADAQAPAAFSSSAATSASHAS